MGEGIVPLSRMNIFDFSLDLHPLLLGDLRLSFAQWYAGRQYSSLFLICDENTARDCAPIFFEKTGIDPAIPKVVIAPGESEKHIGTCQQIWSAMFEAGLDRHSLVFNLGGGVIGDMGGFCAATYKRGIDFVQIPTTLLAATDASTGGKLGIDFHGVKNSVGVFANPAGVLIDPDFFQTLSQRELHSGFAEVLKHAAIGEGDLWEMIAPLQSLHDANWHEILRSSISVKARVVTEDPLEKGLRAVLNYGHTIGHAIESYFLTTAHPLTHGEAVAWGMVYETRIREARGQVYDGPKDFLQTVALEAYITRFFPKINVPEAIFETLWAYMHQDKKNLAGTIKMGLPGTTPFSIEWLKPEKEEVHQAIYG